MQGKKVRQLPDSGASRLHFASPFEERWAIRIACNLIRSHFLDELAEELASLSVAILGRKNFLTLLKRISPECETEIVKSRWSRKRLSLDEIPEGLLQELLEGHVLPQLEIKHKKLQKIKDLTADLRLTSLRSIFGLSELEADIVALCYVIQSCGTLDDLTDRFKSMGRFQSHGPLLIGCQPNQFIGAFADGGLLKLGILELSAYKNQIDLSSWCLNFLLGIGPEDLSRCLFNVYNDDMLDSSDFRIPPSEIEIATKLLSNTEPCNLLLYGKPGTGKTSFARTLAREIGLPLYEVNIPPNDNLSEWMSAILATTAVAEKRNAVVLVDEADDLLNTISAFRYGTASKSWINTYLDSHKTHLIMVTNRIDSSESSSRRRFNFSIEFSAFTHQARKRVLDRELDRAGLRSAVTETELEAISKSYQVNADGMANAVAMLKRIGDIKNVNLAETIRTILKNQERVLGISPAMKSTHDPPYSLELLNTSHKLDDLVTYLRTYVSQDPSIRQPMPLLFHGAPGTGKTAFVRHLGQLLEIEVSLRRCSDIVSKYVGESEQNIAAAFRECHESGSILFFDEADSFLFPRNESRNSWERTLTNEMLACMDSYPGIVIFATNERDCIDRAAVRRFRFKIGFNPLDAAGCRHCYELLLRPLVIDPDNGYTAITNELSNLANATPADFATVRAQFILSSEVSNEDLMAALKNELKHKETSWKQIGF